MLICIPLLGLTPAPVYAFDLSSMWQTKDQQAQHALTAGDAKSAAEKFEDPNWKASAQYRAGDYAAADESFAKSDSAAAHYNRGNALAKSGKLEDAIKAYDEALKRDASSTDAKKNRELVEKLLKQQKQQDKQKNDQQKDSDKKDQDKKDQDKKDQDKQDQKDSKDPKDSKDQKQDDKDSQSEQDKNKQDKQDEEKKNQQSSSENKNQQQDSSAKDANQHGEASSASNQQHSAAAQGQTSSAAASANQSAMAQASSQAQDDKNADPKSQQATIDQNNLTDEQKQALEQWLRRVPDDPGGLLRNKFKYQYMQNRQKKADGEFEPPKNNADQRW